MRLTANEPSVRSIIYRYQLVTMQSEHERLIALLNSLGIEWRLPQQSTLPNFAPPKSSVSFY